METTWYERFESYIQGELGEEERLQLEEELTANSEMRAAFELYKIIELDMKAQHASEDEEIALKASLSELNAKYFHPGAASEHKKVPVYKFPLFRVISGVAATVALFLMVYFLFFQTDVNSRQLADNYFALHLQELGQHMGGAQDTMQLGIAAYNQKKYGEARSYFEAVLQLEPANSEAIENLGLTYLATKDYESALNYFRQLTAIDNLYSNKGLFLQAVTLMQRDEPQDRDQAKSLLKQVVQEDADGSRQAKEWLEIL